MGGGGGLCEGVGVEEAPCHAAAADASGDLLIAYVSRILLYG